MDNVETQLPSASGEIDIIAQDGGCLIFVEVKTRRSQQFGSPFEAVNLRKQRRLAAAALEYMAAQGLEMPVLDSNLPSDAPGGGLCSRRPERSSVRNDGATPAVNSMPVPDTRGRLCRFQEMLCVVKSLPDCLSSDIIIFPGRNHLPFSYCHDLKLLKESGAALRAKRRRLWTEISRKSEIMIEHIFKKMKMFRILLEKYRNRRKRFSLRFNLIAACCNLAVRLS
ncbi:YraN family protein [Desulfobulbus sp. F3]|nr:YraN family protein [Desulfobulbus sp. F3]